MFPIHHPQLIQDLSDTALGLIAEAERVEPQDARALIELAGSLDRLRVKMISDTRIHTRIPYVERWKNEKRH